MPRFPFLSEISQITPSYYDLLLSIVPDFISLSSGRIIYRHHVPFQNVIKYFSRITFTVQFLTSPDGMQIIPITRFKSFVKIWSFIYHFIHQILDSTWVSGCFLPNSRMNPSASDSTTHHSLQKTME